MQPTNILKQAIVAKIKASNTFKKAPTSIALLQYLFDATSKGTHLKEGLVDIEFFGSKNTNEKNNPRVRVNVYNLRKKLTAYYNTEGVEDKWQLTIDKGQYQVRFFKKESNSFFKQKVNWPKLIPYLALITCFTFLVLTNIPPKTPQIWKSFLQKGVITNLFIGDHFGITGKTTTGNNGWTRDFKINNVKEFYNLLDKKPELKAILKPSTYSYSTRMAALATQGFQKFYQEYDKAFHIRFSTQSSISEIKESNAIYVGPSKNGNKFVSFFNEGNPYFTLTSHSLTLLNHPEIASKKIEINRAVVDEEYAIVSKYPSINNAEHFVFFSQHDIGVSGTVEYFTNTDSLKVFKDKFLKNHKYFTAVFKVKGQDRTNTNIKLEMVVPF